MRAIAVEPTNTKWKVTFTQNTFGYPRHQRPTGMTWGGETNLYLNDEVCKNRVMMRKLCPKDTFLRFESNFVVFPTEELAALCYMKFA